MNITELLWWVYSHLCLGSEVRRLKAVYATGKMGELSGIYKHRLFFLPVAERTLLPTNTSLGNDSNNAVTNIKVRNYEVLWASSLFFFFFFAKHFLKTMCFPSISLTGLICSCNYSGSLQVSWGGWLENESSVACCERSDLCDLPCIMWSSVAICQGWLHSPRTWTYLSLLSLSFLFYFIPSDFFNGGY